MTAWRLTIEAIIIADSNPAHGDGEALLETLKGDHNWHCEAVQLTPATGRFGELGEEDQLAVVRLINTIASHRSTDTASAIKAAVKAADKVFDSHYQRQS
jgi:hypothetical protein